MELERASMLIGKLKEADVVLVSEKGIRHAVNRVLQRSKWHHVMLYIGQGRTLEVTPRNGAHICDLLHDLTEKHYVAIKALRNSKLTEKNKDEIIRYAIKNFLKKKFSLTQYVRIVLGRRLHWKDGNRSLVCRPGHKCNIESVVCSNMVAIAYYEAGFPISQKYMPEYVVPKDYEEAKEFKTVINKKLKTS